MSVLQRNINYALHKQHAQTFFLTDEIRPEKLMFQWCQSRHKPIEDIETDHDFALEGKHISEEEYWDQYYTDTPYEWNNGVLEVKPLSDFRSNLLRIWFEALLHEYRNIHKQFQEISCEIGFRMCLKKGNKVRKPDIGFVGPNSLQMEENDCSYKGIFDLCVEFLSDSRQSEVKRDTEQKFQEYEEAGVKEYFILDRNEKHTAFYRLYNGRYKALKPKDGIIQSEVLKDFQFRIAHLYSRPDLNDLIEDPVYQHYVKLDKKKADHEKKRADEKQKLFEIERKRAERYRKKLLELGVDL